MTTTAPAAAAWADALAAWAVPAEILAAAPASPWGCPPALFAASAERSLDPALVASPSRARACEVLDDGDTVLDVGVGGGAASLPLAPPAGRLVGLDTSAGMLAAFAAAADRLGVAHREVLGAWPAAAREAGPADVVVCHHVFFNVGALVPFAAALTAHARRRVVVELTAAHPLVPLNPLWKAFHGIDRPTSPTAADAVAVLEEMGLAVHVEGSEAPGPWGDGDRPALVAFARRRLCVGPERDAEIDAVLAPTRGQGSPPRRIVTLWWEGGAA